VVHSMYLTPVARSVCVTCSLPRIALMNSSSTRQPPRFDGSIATGKARRTLKGHDLAVTSLAFSPDANLLGCGAGNASVVLWDVQTGKLNRVLK